MVILFVLNLLKSLVAFKTTLLFWCSGSMLEAWKGYIAMEIENGNLNEARSLYRRCYTKRFPGRGSEVYLFLLLYRIPI